MNDKIREQISALMDDELSTAEQGLALQRLCKDQDLCGVWERYHLVRDALQSELPNMVDVDLATRIMAGVEQEPPLHPGRELRGTVRTVLKPVAGLAIAASVAVVSVVGLQAYRQSQSMDQGLPPALANAHVQGGQVRLASENRWASQGPEVESRLNGYLVNHNEYSSSPDFQGMMNYVRIVGYDPQQ